MYANMWQGSILKIGSGVALKLPGSLIVVLARNVKMKYQEGRLQSVTSFWGKQCLYRRDVLLICDKKTFLNETIMSLKCTNGRGGGNGLIKQNNTRDEGRTALFAANTVGSVDAIYMVYTVDTAYTVMWLKLLIWVMWLTRLRRLTGLMGLTGLTGPMRLIWLKWHCA